MLAKHWFRHLCPFLQSRKEKVFFRADRWAAASFSDLNKLICAKVSICCQLQTNRFSIALSGAAEAASSILEREHWDTRRDPRGARLPCRARKLLNGVRIKPSMRSMTVLQVFAGKQTHQRTQICSCVWIPVPKNHTPGAT